MFKEDETTGLPVKQTKKQTLKRQTSSPTTRKAKATGKRTVRHPTHKLQTTRGMSLQADDTLEKKTTEPEKPESSHSDDNRSTTSSEDIATSPKRQNQKNTLTSTGTPKEIDTKPPIGA